MVRGHWKLPHLVQVVAKCFEVSPNFGSQKASVKVLMAKIKSSVVFFFFFNFYFMWSSVFFLKSYKGLYSYQLSSFLQNPVNKSSVDWRIKIREHTSVRRASHLCSLFLPPQNSSLTGLMPGNFLLESLLWGIINQAWLRWCSVVFVVRCGDDIRD